VASGFTNNGLIEFTNINNGGQAAVLSVTNGTLTNAPGGTIASLATGGSTRTLDAQLDNQGTVDVSQALTLSHANAVHSNSGTITLTAGNFTVTQSGGAASFLHVGTVTIPAGRTFAINGLLTVSGTISGSGT